MNKHTPGPWRLTSHPHDANYMRIHCGIDPNEGAHLMGYCGEANARLIAAAPDLLEALKALTHSLDEGELLHDDQRNAFAASLKAISKATG